MKLGARANAGTSFVRSIKSVPVVCAVRTERRTRPRAIAAEFVGEVGSEYSAAGWKAMMNPRIPPPAEKLTLVGLDSSWVRANGGRRPREQRGRCERTYCEAGAWSPSPRIPPLDADPTSRSQPRSPPPVLDDSSDDSGR